MSLKAELETWAAALKAYDEQDFGKALDLFNNIADSSKILTNMGLIYATMGEHEIAIERYMEATSLDQFLAVAYFQWGVSNFLLGNFKQAFDNFEDTLLYLRGNQDINYEQLGLKFKLYAAEVVFNKGICQMYMQRVEDGIETLNVASQIKVTEEHNVIDEAIRDRGDGYTVFSVPVGILYRPSEKKLKNAVTKDYMGKAKLVAASDPNDIYTEFSGAARLRDGITPTGIYINRPQDVDSSLLARSATAPYAKLPQPKEYDLIPRSASLVERSKTTINVPVNYRERIAPKAAESLSDAPRIPTPPITPPNLGRPKGLGSLSRGPSTRRAAPVGLNIPPISNAPSIPPSNQGKNDASEGISDFYDTYLDPYGGIDPAVPAQVYPGNNRANALQQDSPLARGQGSLRSAPVDGSIRKKPAKRNNQSRGPSYPYEEEEEGYGSGEYEEVPFEMAKIRVKIHYRDEVRGMTLMADATFAEFMDKVTAKFDKSIMGLGIKFKDEDGSQVSLRDESDFELAIETARETTTRGKLEGKLEIWCTDI